MVPSRYCTIRRLRLFSVVPYTPHLLRRLSILGGSIFGFDGDGDGSGCSKGQLRSSYFLFKEWNEIPLKIRNSESIRSFRNAVLHLLA